MKTIEEKKELIKNFEGFYVLTGFILFENPVGDLLDLRNNNRFEKPEFISLDYNVIMGTQQLNKTVSNRTII